MGATGQEITQNDPAAILLKNFGVNLATAGIGTEGKFVVKAGKYVVNLAARTAGDTAIDVFVRDKGVGESIVRSGLGNALGDTAGKIIGTGLKYGGKGFGYIAENTNFGKNLASQGKRVVQPAIDKVKSLTGRGGAGASKRRFSLGVEDHLDDFTRRNGAESWKQWAKDDPMNWQSKFYDVMNDADAEVLFNLDSVDVWGGITRASRGAGGATDWELLQIYSNKDWWSRIKWIKNDAEVPNPFK